MLAQRVLSAAIGIPLIVALTLIDGAPYIAAVAVVLAGAALEFYSATDPEAAVARRPASSGDKPSLANRRLPSLLASAVIGGIAIAASGGLDEMTGAFAAAAAAVFLLLLLRGDAESGLRDWTWLLAGLAYVGFLGAHLVL